MDGAYASYQARLDTFAPPKSKSRRPSSRSKKTAPKAAQKGGWPHAAPRPEDLAYGGFIFKPTSASHDNVQCFSCQTQLDGWEENDTPAFEHLTHSPNCGFAINICIRIRGGDPGRTEDNPLSETILQARRDTFANLWPLDADAGFPTVDQMIEAGWYYDPSDEMPDGVTCPYCSLSLDAWDAGDDPIEEHRKRSSDCLFFTLKEFYYPTQKPKATRGKRASTRSSTASSKAVKTTKPRKAASKEELNKPLPPPPDESIISFVDPVPDSFASSADAPPPKPLKKGRKTKKAALEESVVESFVESVAEYMDPPPKPATKGRKAKKAPMEESIIAESFADSTMSKASQAPIKGRTAKKTPARASNTSVASTRATRQKKRTSEDMDLDDAPLILSPKRTQKKRTSEDMDLNDAPHMPSPKRTRTSEVYTSDSHESVQAPMGPPLHHSLGMISDLSRSDFLESTPTTTPKGEKSESNARPQTPTTPEADPSATGWEPIDIDAFFAKRDLVDIVTDVIVDSGLDKENIDMNAAPTALGEQIMARLTSPEKEMTIEQWIRYNAKRGEQQLRAECERQIAGFEAQYRRALAALDAA